MALPKIRKCPRDGCELIDYTPMDGKPHHGQFTCSECGRHMAWVSKALSSLLNRIIH